MLGALERARELLRDGLAAAREIGQVDLIIGGFTALGVVYAREDPDTRGAPAGSRGCAARGNGVPQRRPGRAAYSGRGGSRVTGEAGRGRLRGGLCRGVRTRARE